VRVVVLRAIGRTSRRDTNDVVERVPRWLLALRFGRVHLNLHLIARVQR
jgi:hypothetical protein